MTETNDLLLIADEAHNYAVDSVLVEDAEDDGFDEAAPYGYMIDPGTGERRPKKRPGRQKVSAPVPSPSVEQLKPIQREEADRAPERSKGRKRPQEKESKPSEPIPAFRAGPIAKGMNSLYRKAGKIIRVMDQDIGDAVIACTRKLDEDDVTVGEAWEELARTNPRVRAFLLKLITGGAWTQIFVAHLPIFMAVLMKDCIRQRIPFMGFVTSFMDDSDDPEEVQQDPFGGLLSGMTQEDMAQAMTFANGLMGNMASNVQRSPTGRTVTAEHFPIED